MADISYNEARLEEISNDFTRAHQTANAIKSDIYNSIGKIKLLWTGSDNVTEQRNIDFKKIEDNLEDICQNLDSTEKYLTEKNAAFKTAAENYRA